MAIDPAALANVTLVSDAPGFAAALRRLAETPKLPPQDRKASDTRRLYERLFAFEAYVDAIAECLAPLLPPQDFRS
jgi:hypothetical protein